MPKHVGEKKGCSKWSCLKHFRRHAAIQNDGLSARPADSASTVHQLASPPPVTKAEGTEEETSSRLWTTAWRNMKKKNLEAVEY